MNDKSKKFNKSYIGERSDLLNLIPANIKNILDVGCSTGTLGRQIKEKMDVKVTGIELSQDMAEVATKHLDKVIVGNVEQGLLEELDNNEFDCIILGDIIEHLKNPWLFIAECHRILKKDGIIIASIPNIRHISTIYNLVIRGYWPYRDRGIHDRTHLRFFTIKNIKELFEKQNFKNINCLKKYRIIENPHKLNNLSKLISFILFPLKHFFVFQYIVTYKK